MSPLTHCARTDFPVPTGPHSNAHRQTVEGSALSSAASHETAPCRLLVNHVCEARWADELQRAAALPSSSRFSALVTPRRSASSDSRRLDQHVQIGERDAGGERCKLRRAEIGKLFDRG